MAYIRKRGKTWYYTVDVGKDPVTGERRQVSKGGFRTKKEAELAAAVVETEVARGTYLKEQKIPFREYAQTWLEWYKAGVISKKPKPSSIRQREYQIRCLLNFFDVIDISKITHKSYQNALIKMSKELARNTLLGVHSTARMIFSSAKREGIIKIDPTEHAKVPSADDDEEKLPKYMEKEQLAEFLRLAKYRGLDLDYIIFLTLAYTGMRVGELCALKWSDVDFENCTITIKGTLHNPADRADQYDILTPKTKASRRTIDVDPIVIEELKRLKAKQNEFKMKHRKIYHDADFVFARMDKPNHASKSNYYGYPFKRRTIELRMNRLTQWMNLPTKLTPHSLRHTHTSLLAEAGVSLEAIMERLGHKDDKVTRLVYLHVTKTMKKEASAKFSALMSKVVKL